MLSLCGVGSGTAIRGVGAICFACGLGHLKEAAFLVDVYGVLRRTVLPRSDDAEARSRWAKTRVFVQTWHRAGILPDICALPTDGA